MNAADGISGLRLWQSIRWEPPGTLQSTATLFLQLCCCNLLQLYCCSWQTLAYAATPTKEEQWSRIMPRANQVAESHQEPHADFRPRKKSAKRERLVKITYVGPMGQRQHRFIRESAIPDFLRTRVQRCS